ncbi:metalloprotease 1 precursor [Phyllosticta capitalensis]|uniref:Metalloprotease 1 n=1 Tax=Phyllosticta capitalensis TaxID=121624 RepID=A0ABR1Z3Q5_9PEZI
MAHKAILILTLVMLALAGHGLALNLTCLTSAPDQDQLAVIKQMALAENHAMAHGQDMFGNQVLDVPTYFHVLSESENAEGGWIPDSQLDSLIAQLNAEYNKHRISFTLRGKTHTVNAQWANALFDKAFSDAREALRAGGYGSLNVFFQKSVGDHQAGSFCTRPASAPTDYSQDGCTLILGMYNVATLTHEVGHWLGLLHTFEGGCNADPVHGGDYVADTPAQASTNYSDCTLGRDSCPTLAGRDPIFNHMSYSSCSNRHFTHDQGVRMHNQWNYYRAGYE